MNEQNEIQDLGDALDLVKMGSGKFDIDSRTGLRQENVDIVIDDENE